MKCPIFELGSRFLFKEEVRHKPSCSFWLRISQERPRFNCSLSRGMRASSRTKTVKPVANPSLSISCPVPSSRFHVLRKAERLQPRQVPASAGRFQPSSFCCLLKTSLTIDFCCAEFRSPGNFVEAQSRKRRLRVLCEESCLCRYSLNTLRFPWISGVS